MSFKDYEYKRPNIEELKEKFTAALEKFDNAKTVEEQNKSFIQLTKFVTILVQWGIFVTFVILLIQQMLL